MERNSAEYQQYITILNEELIPAMGCTEPIAIAYAAALAKKVLEQSVEEVHIYASGNIIKNVKSVTVPNTGGRKGMEAAAAIGIVAGDSDAVLEVIAHVSKEEQLRLQSFMEKVPMHIHHTSEGHSLDIMVELWHGKSSCKVRIINEHANVVYVEKDGVVMYEKKWDAQSEQQESYSNISMSGIYEFAQVAKMEDVESVLARQIQCNTAIAEEGLACSYGANIASVLLASYGDCVQVRARAMAAAGSDARMSGCELPVIINSGSGNQGMTASLPVIVYAKELHSSKEQLYRALIISNLSTIYQKQHIGRLSAYCGVVSAGAGAGAGIAYLQGGDFDHICHTIVNTLAITSGIICDGAKPSCAAKIATAVDAGIMGCMMYQKGKQFYRGEGIVCRNIEDTIIGVGHLARDGMKETDEEIIKMMMKN